MNDIKKPDYRLSVYNRVTKQKADLGAAWINTDGSISIKLNYKAVLSQADDDSLHLWPAPSAGQTDWKAKGAAQAARPTPTPAPAPMRRVQQPADDGDVAHDF